MVQHFLLERIKLDLTIDEHTKERVLGQLQSSFRPEFLNRIDDIILFKPLSLSDIKGIVTKLAGELQTRLNMQHIYLVMTEEAKKFIANAAYDPVYGARPLKRYLQSRIETNLAKEIIAGNVHPYDTITVDVSRWEFENRGNKSGRDLTMFRKL